MRNQRHLLPLGFFLLVAAAQVASAAEPRVSIQDAQISEGDAGTKNLDFSVDRSDDNSTNVVVEYSTTESATNAAITGEDYEAVERALVHLPAGIWSSALSVKVLGDTTPEPDENFLLHLERVMSFNPTPDFEVNPPLATGAFPTSVGIGDMDGDGLPDLITTDHQAGNVSLRLNRATAGGGVNLSEAQTIAGGLVGPHDVAIGDLNADGRPDLVVPLEYEDRVLIVPNGGGLDFSGAHAIDIRSAPYAAAIGDLDGDGRPDVVVANASSNDLSVLRSIAANGAVGFESVQYVPVGISPHSVVIKDFDSDGLGDIAVVNTAENTLSVLRSTSGGGAISFAPAQVYPVGAGAEDAASADLDGDGDADLVVANAYSGDVSVLQNLSTAGTPAFAPAQPFAAGEGAYSVALADVNGDGKPEAIVSSYHSDGVAVLRNTSTGGTPGFAAPMLFAAGDGPWAVAVGALDGDGKPELAVANADANTVSVLRNSPGFTAAFDDNEALGVITNDDGGLPNQFKFTDRSRVARNRTMTSNTIRIRGMTEPGKISVAGGTYSIGCVGRNFTAQPGLIKPDQTVCVRHVSAAEPNTATDTVLTIGGVSDTYTTVTR